MEKRAQWAEELCLLADHGWLADTPETFRAAVLGRCSVRRFSRNEPIYRQGDPAGALYGLIEGELGVEIEPEDRIPYLGLLVRPGFWVGEGSVMTRRQYMIGMRCTRDCVVAYLPLAEWDIIVRDDPEAWRWLGMLALRNSLLAIRVADALMVRRAGSRLAAILVVIAATGAASGDGRLEFTVGQDELAGMTNLSRSSVERILGEFESEGLIERRYRRIRIRDLAGLRKRRAESSVS